MNNQLILVGDKKLSIYKDDDLINIENWIDEDFLAPLGDINHIYILYMGTISSYRNAVLMRRLESNNINYEVINKNKILLDKHIYGKWTNESEEVSAIGAINTYIFIEKNSTDIEISIFRLQNSLIELQIDLIYEKVAPCIYHENKKYDFLHIKELLKDGFNHIGEHGIMVDKVFLIDGYLNGEKIKSYFYKEFLEENVISIPIVDEKSIIRAFKIYLSKLNGDIKTPFYDKKIEYLNNSICLEMTYMEDMVLSSEEIFYKNEILPLNKEITINPINSVESGLELRVRKGEEVHSRRIIFPFIYRQSEMVLEFSMENNRELNIKIYLKDELIDIWDLKWR